jgi:hypothetical protein
MAEHALKQEFDSYFNMLSDVQKQSLLSLMKSFLSEQEKTQRISIEQYNSELEAAERRIGKGQFVSHETLRKEAEKW